MFAEVMEWEAKGDGLRRAKKFHEALEAYRTALRFCFQWKRESRVCTEIREKIWAVQIEDFEAFAATASSIVDEETKRLAGSPDTLELAIARLWSCGAKSQAEKLVESTVGQGARGSGELLDRLAERAGNNEDCRHSFHRLARRLRGENDAVGLNIGKSAAYH